MAPLTLRGSAEGGHHLRPNRAHTASRLPKRSILACRAVGALLEQKYAISV